MKPVLLAVTNDVVHDRRIYRIASSLVKAGYHVKIIGRKRRNPTSQSPFPFQIRRFSMIFNRGVLFYACFNIRLFFYLLFHRAILLVANDLDTLLAVYLVSVIRRIPIIYDTHEYFTGVPEVEQRPVVKKVWTSIEQAIFPKLKHITTVNDSIAQLYTEKYGVPIQVVRNLAYRYEAIPKTHKELQLPEGTKMIILQGTGINKGRGAEEAVMAMKHCHNVVLFVIGSGNALPYLKILTDTNHLNDRIRFIPVQPYPSLMQYTASADLGLSLDKPDFLNFRYSLPNKLFDYIQAGIPVLASDLPEVGNIVRTYQLGELTTTFDPEILAARIMRMINDDTKQANWRNNAKKAAPVLCWEEEEKKVLTLYKQVLEDS